MKKLAFIFMFFLSVHAEAQKLYLYPTAAVAPRGSYQTVTAIVTGVNDKTVTWTASDGKLVGTNPCVVNEPCTIALYTKTAGTYTLTARSNTNPTVRATSTITITPSPTPVLTHPRLYITAAMLPGLQAKATSKNAIYQAIRKSAIDAYNKDKPTWSWSCKSGTGLPTSPQYTGWSKEQDAYLFAYMSLIDPSDPTYNWGCYGHDLWVYVMGGVISGAQFTGSNDWADNAQQYMFTTDWLIGSGHLNPSEQATARSFFAKIVKNSMNLPYGTNGPVAPYNSPTLISNGRKTDLTTMRWMGNNYTMAKILFLAAAGLTFNDNTTDDPPLPNTCSATRYQVCPDFTAGSLHAYFSYAVGSMLYMDWAHLSDPSVVQQAYNSAFGNVPAVLQCEYIDASLHPCFGDGRGGEAAEGSYYSESFSKLRQAFNLIYTAGYNDPTIWGPQMSLSTDSFWDLKYMEDSAFLTTNAIKNGPSTGSPAYSFLTTGDTYMYFRYPSDFNVEAELLTFDSYTGRSDRFNGLEWPILNVAFGGPVGTSGGCTVQCGFDTLLTTSYAGPTTSIPYDLYIALPAGDPTSSLPPDPRPSYPTDLYNASYNQHTMIRSSWSPGATLYSEYCPNAMIDHEEEFCGRFDIMANGEYITKGRVEFNDYNTWVAAAPQQNIASIINADLHGYPCTGCYFAYAVDGGGQFWHGQQAGLVSNLHSELPGYAAEIADTTNVSNGWWTWWGPADYNDVTGSSRSIVYLRGTNQVVFYDRATTGHANAKSISQITTGPITLAGPVASWPTRSGTQKAYFTSLLPSGATVSDAGLPCVNCSVDQAWDWEPATTIKVSAGKPLSTQFLSVVEWGPSSLKQSATTLVHSTSGMNFDGALIGSSLVMFMRNWPATFTGTTYPVSGATTLYISDLAPNTTYTLSATGAPASATTDTAGVLTFKAAGTGDVTIRAAQSVRAGLSVQTGLYVVGATMALSAIAFAVARGTSQF